MTCKKKMWKILFITLLDEDNARPKRGKHQAVIVVVAVGGAKFSN